MKRYSQQEIENAKELRKKGRYSFAQLQRLTGIPGTTIRNWCADDFLGTRWDTALITYERRRQALKASEITILDSLREIDSSLAKILTSLLYWCEGAKYPGTNKVDFTNSDPKLLQLFIILLRRAFTLDSSKFRVHVQIHTVQNFEDVRKFWSKLLDIPESQFIKPTITKMKGGKHRKEYHGTCSVRYMDFRILLKLTGIYETFFSRFGTSN